MQNQKMEDHQTDTNKTNFPHKDGVIITVYVESHKTHNNSHRNTDPLKKINPNVHYPKTPKSRGYDRRAQLLAYSRDLRNVDSPRTQLPTSKSKKWKWKKVRSETAAPARYERVGKGSEERAEVVDQPCRPKCFHTRRKKSTGKSASSILMKLKGLLRKLSKGCKRSGGD